MEVPTHPNVIRILTDYKRFTQFYSASAVSTPACECLLTGRFSLRSDTPHDPYEPAPSPHLEKYQAMGVTGNQLCFRSMISCLDENIGMLTPVQARCKRGPLPELWKNYNKYNEKSAPLENECKFVPLALGYYMS